MAERQGLNLDLLAGRVVGDGAQVTGAGWWACGSGDGWIVAVSHSGDVVGERLGLDAAEPTDVQAGDLTAADQPPHLRAADRQALGGFLDGEEHAIGGSQRDVDDLTGPAPATPASWRWADLEPVHGVGPGHGDLPQR